MCFEFLNTRTPLLVTVQKFGKSEIDLFVVSKLRPSNYGHSGLNFRKTRVQLTVKLHLRSLQKIGKAELSTCIYLFRRLLLSYKHWIGLACRLPNKGSQFCRRERWALCLQTQGWKLTLYYWLPARATIFSILVAQLKSNQPRNMNMSCLCVSYTFFK